MNTLEKDTRIKCSLCGAEFEAEGNTCGGCIVRKDCRLICCPNCGFGIPRESKVASRIRRWFEKERN